MCFNMVSSQTEKCFYFVLKLLGTSEKMTEQRKRKKEGNKMTTQPVKVLADKLTVIFHLLSVAHAHPPTHKQKNKCK